MKTILVADDNAVSRELMREALETEEWLVIEACNGREVLERMAEATPDLVLMDIQMPDLDGFAALGELRKDPRFSTVPVLALTAFAMKGDCEKALAAGFEGYVTKPVDIAALRKRIGGMLSK